MWRDALDDRPGLLPETRILGDATVLVVFRIAWGATAPVRGHLVLRFDQHGEMYAALQDSARSQQVSEDPRR
jgi:hypothetical protein